MHRYHYSRPKVDGEDVQDARGRTVTTRALLSSEGVATTRRPGRELPRAGSADGAATPHSAVRRKNGLYQRYGQSTGTAIYAISARLIVASDRQKIIRASQTVTGRCSLSVSLGSCPKRSRNSQENRPRWLHPLRRAMAVTVSREESAAMRSR